MRDQKFCNVNMLNVDILGFHIGSLCFKILLKLLHLHMSLAESIGILLLHYLAFLISTHMSHNTQFLVTTVKKYQKGVGLLLYKIVSGLKESMQDRAYTGLLV